MSTMVRCALQTFRIFSISPLFPSIPFPSTPSRFSRAKYARQKSRVRRAKRRTRPRKRTVDMSIDFRMLLFKLAGISSLISRRNFIFDIPYEYSMPTPAISGWYFGDKTKRCPRLSTTCCSAVLSRRKRLELHKFLPIGYQPFPPLAVERAFLCDVQTGPGVDCFSCNW